MNPPSRLRLVPLRGTEDPDTFAATVSRAHSGDETQPRALLAQTKCFLDGHPRPDPWGSYVAYDSNEPIGFCAYKSAPDAAGAVEIAYGTFPAYEGQGYAKRTISALVELAAKSGATLVFAHTLAQDNPSNSALRNQGFSFIGESDDPEDGVVWRWELPL
jgi:RimJ/RimL family protein N-acetyltransferase